MTPLDERSARRRDLYATLHKTHRCPWHRRDSNPQSKQASGHRPTPLDRTAMGIGSTYTNVCKEQGWPKRSSHTALMRFIQVACKSDKLNCALKLNNWLFAHLVNSRTSITSLCRQQKALAACSQAVSSVATVRFTRWRLGSCVSSLLNCTSQSLSAWPPLNISGVFVNQSVLTKNDTRHWVSNTVNHKTVSDLYISGTYSDFTTWIPQYSTNLDPCHTRAHARTQISNSKLPQILNEKSYLIIIWTS